MIEKLGPSVADSKVGPPLQSKLSPENQAFIATPEFLEKFGASAMTDPEIGEPQLWYHGTNRQFDEFEHPKDLTQLSNCGLEHDSEGIYLTSTVEFSDQYADPLGAEFLGVMSQLLGASGGKTYADAFATWNELVRSLVNNHPRVSFKNGLDSEPTVEPKDVDEAVRLGSLQFSAFMQIDGQRVGLLGEFLQLFGGSFPRAEDELTAYSSLFPDAQARIEQYAKIGGRLLIPSRALPRIVPVFVSSEKPLMIQGNGAVIQGMDAAFAQGIQARAKNFGTDAIIVDGGDGSMFARSALVFDPSKLIIAPTL